MKKLFLSLASAALAVGAACLPQTASAQTNNADWLNNVCDETYVANLLLPGAHDAATGEGWSGSFFVTPTYANTSTCQSKKVSELFDLGVRVFDIRPSNADNPNCNHGVATTKMTVAQFLQTLISKLEAHPGEFAILHVLAVEDNATFHTRWNNFLQTYKDHFVEFHRGLTVGEMRGKILMINRANYNTPDPYNAYVSSWTEDDMRQHRILGNDYHSASLYVQDIANVYNNDKWARRDEKKALLKSLFDNTKVRVNTRPTQLNWVFNFASAYNASASSSSDYKNVAKVMNQFIADELNAMMNQRAYGKKDIPSGMVMMDYVGDSSADPAKAYDAIIKSNFVSHNVTGVENVRETAGDTEIVGYYDLNGRLVASPEPGKLVIVRYADGSAKKVIL